MRPCYSGVGADAEAVRRMIIHYDRPFVLNKGVCREFAGESQLSVLFTGR
jgi:hypothetical protein